MIVLEQIHKNFLFWLISNVQLDFLEVVKGNRGDTIIKVTLPSKKDKDVVERMAKKSELVVSDHYTVNTKSDRLSLFLIYEHE